MTVEFEINGKTFTALNGGPEFKFKSAQICGWLKDKYGLSWQIIPEEMLKLVEDQTRENGKRAFAAMMKMKKIDLAAIKAAYNGKVPSGVAA